MSGYTIRYSDEALQNLRDIYDYVSAELKAPGIAAVQVSRIREEIRSLDLFPMRNKTVEWEPWSSRGLRQMPVDRFVVFYIVSDKAKEVQINRIIYGKRDLPNIITGAEE